MKGASRRNFGIFALTIGGIFCLPSFVYACDICEIFPPFCNPATPTPTVTFTPTPTATPTTTPTPTPTSTPTPTPTVTPTPSPIQVIVNITTGSNTNTNTNNNSNDSDNDVMVATGNVLVRTGDQAQTVSGGPVAVPGGKIAGALTSYVTAPPRSVYNVPVTAQTGPGSLALVSTLLGSAGLGFVVRRW